jgi:hypothetical protein
LKNLELDLYRKEKDGRRTRLSVGMQILEAEAEYLLIIRGRRKKEPNAPGSSKRKHYERANQKKWKRDFEWPPPQQSIVKPKVEPPRPPGWKPFVITPQAIQTQEEVRRIASQRLKEWGKDQEEYMKREHELMEEKRARRRHDEEDALEKKETEESGQGGKGNQAEKSHTSRIDTEVDEETLREREAERLHVERCRAFSELTAQMLEEIRK